MKMLAARALAAFDQLCRFDYFGRKRGGLLYRIQTWALVTVDPEYWS